MFYENYDMENVVTPMNADILEELLIESQYNAKKTKFLVDGFRNGFSIGYEGPEDVKQTALNLALHVGSESELWNKVMKEVKLKRFAGPFNKIPFDSYIQSPIRLVPKDAGLQTCLIFHLSYLRTGAQKRSVNANTPIELCKVRYLDFDMAIARCRHEGKSCSMGKSDISSAFRNLGILKKHWKYLIMKVRNPETGDWCYFFDKCLPFGASISCAHFQAVSDAIAHLVKWRTGKGKDVVNYLDDFLFLALLKWLCDQQIEVFMDICKQINLPVNMDKTFWSSTQIIFLGLLIDSTRQMVFLPLEKITRGREMIIRILEKRNRKITVKDLQQLCGFLNFLSRAIVLGRAFTRRLYSNTASKKGAALKPHHHIKVNQEMRLDLEMWKIFLHHHSVFACPFMDFTHNYESQILEMMSDASRNPTLGVAAICQESWAWKQWDANFIQKYQPSIEYLELYGVVISVLLWANRFANRRVTLFCDNQSVVEMLNSNTSSCKNCMVLIRIFVLECMIQNVKIRAAYISSRDNFYSDSLSRLKFDKFWSLAKQNNRHFDEVNTEIPDMLWPMDKIWLN